MKKERHKAICAVYLILIQDDKLLLCLRQNSGYCDGMYGLVAGHVEARESIQHAMVREAKEEAGIEIAELDFLHVSYRNAKDHERVDFYFRAKKWKGKIENKEPHKCSELKFFSLSDLPENLIDHVGEVIDFSLKGKKFSECGWEDSPLV